MKKDIQDLITKNYTSARTIASNVGKVELDATHAFLLEVKEVVETKISKAWSVKVDDDLNKTWTGLRVSNSNWPDASVKLEGQSKVPWNESIYGIHSHKDEWSTNVLKDHCSSFDLFSEDTKSNDYWPHFKSMMSLSSVSDRARLFNDNDRKILVAEVGEKLIELVQLCDKPLTKKTK